MSKGVGLNLFKNILHTSIEYLKNIFRHLGHNIWWHGKIFYHVFMDERYLWMKFSMNVGNKFFCKKLNKRDEMEEIYVGVFWKIHHMKCSSQTSTNTSYFLNIKYILALQHPNHIKFEIKSNSMAHKLVDPPKGTCQFKHYLFTTKRHAPIRNWNNMM
jgi:hypothetical protein